MNYSKGSAKNKEGDMHKSDNKDKVKRCKHCHRAYENYTQAFQAERKPQMLPNDLWSGIPLPAGICMECKNKIPERLSAVQVSILMDIENTTYKEREVFFQAYQYDRRRDEYFLVKKPLAELIKNKLIMEGITL